MLSVYLPPQLLRISWGELVTQQIKKSILIVSPVVITSQLIHYLKNTYANTKVTFSRYG